MLIAKFFIYFIVMVVCGISIIDSPELAVQLILLVGVVVSFVLAFSVVTEIKE